MRTPPSLEQAWSSLVWAARYGLVAWLPASAGMTVVGLVGALLHSDVTLAKAGVQASWRVQPRTVRTATRLQWGHLQGLVATSCRTPVRQLPG